MPSPFPGMNPFLERPDLWHEVHHGLISSIAYALTPQVRPKYRVAIEVRIYREELEEPFVGRPDVAVLHEQTAVAYTVATTLPRPVRVPVFDEIREGYLEVREVATNNVITAIEILSLSNKRPSKGRQAYETKRNHVLASATHLVEIDLLRAGEPMRMFDTGASSDYRILVSRAERRPRADLYAFSVRQPIPSFPIPLQREDTEPRLDVQTLLHELYDRAGFDLAIDYRSDPMPPLSEADAAWADALLRAKGLRG
jgi:hypothetical protein